MTITSTPVGSLLALFVDFYIIIVVHGVRPAERYYFFKIFIHSIMHDTQYLFPVSMHVRELASR